KRPNLFVKRVYNQAGLDTYEHGYGGAHYDKEIAWAYYLKAAQLGSPEAQMALADAYAKAGRFQEENTMAQCAYQQGHGPAAFALGVDMRASQGNFLKAITYFQNGTKFGSHDCAVALSQLFGKGFWVTTSEQEKPLLTALGIHVDPERYQRYRAIADTLEINPDLKLARLDHVLPLPPAKLAEWSGVSDAVEPEPSGRPSY
ncbi:MAG: DUF6396 domain-containing protein, partial [Pseudomonadota bacterium]